MEELNVYMQRDDRAVVIAFVDTNRCISQAV